MLNLSKSFFSGQKSEKSLGKKEKKLLLLLLLLLLCVCVCLSVYKERERERVCVSMCAFKMLEMKQERAIIITECRPKVKMSFFWK
jgi:hypothetical protein